MIKRLHSKKPVCSVNARLVTSACEETESHNCAFCLKYYEVKSVRDLTDYRAHVMEADS